MNTSAPVFATVAAVVAAAAMTASCSLVTGGTPVAQHGSASAPASAAAPTNSAATPAPPTPVSAEDQIRQTLMAFADAANTQNWDAYLELMCSAMRVKFTGPVMDYVKKGRAESGMTTIKAITSIVITGDTATARMDTENESLGTRSVTMPLKLEDGWKVCQL
jgi:hypothetical protein